MYLVYMSMPGEWKNCTRLLRRFCTNLQGIVVHTRDIRYLMQLNQVFLFIILQHFGYYFTTQVFSFLPYQRFSKLENITYFYRYN